MSKETIDEILAIKTIVFPNPYFVLRDCAANIFDSLNGVGGCPLDSFQYVYDPVLPLAGVMNVLK
ncbi:hypothetical protein BH23GEM10_BH23GEM10_09480 [soil metagenome]